MSDADETKTVVVNGQYVVMVSSPDERVGVLAHRALAAEEYDWTAFEIRDEAGRLLAPNTRCGEIPGLLYVTKPIGWGG